MENRAGRSAHFERPATLICSTRGANRRLLYPRRLMKCARMEVGDFRAMAVEDHRNTHADGRGSALRGVYVPHVLNVVESFWSWSKRVGAAPAV